MILLLSSLLSLVLFHQSLTSSSVTNASVRGPVTQRMAPDMDSSFNVVNQTTVNVGWCNVHLSNNTYSYIYASGQGTFSTTLAYGPYECTIHGQTFGMNYPTRIIIDAHTSVRATWTGNVITIDEEMIM
jgi:hypothetical protein